MFKSQKTLGLAFYLTQCKAMQVTEVGGRFVCQVMLLSRRLSVREASLSVTRLIYLLEAFEQTFEKGYMLA